MSLNFSIKVLFDNYKLNEDLKESWGYSCYIEGFSKNILFDTGAKGDILLYNMEKKGITPDSIGIIFISHYDWDHKGGLESILQKNSNVKVCYPSSFPDSFHDEMVKWGALPLKIDRLTQICSNVYSTGEMEGPRNEQGLILKIDGNIILLTGCAHPGIFNMASLTKKAFNEDFLLVMGGFHLKDKKIDEIDKIAKSLKSLGIRYIAPSHCTGDKGREVLKKIFGDNYIISGLGKEIKFNDLI